MNLFLVGLNHKTAPIEVREKLNFSDEYSKHYLEKLSGTPSVQSGIVLSTCNRVEIYAAGSENDLHQKLKGFIYDCHNLHNMNMDPYFYLKVDEDAVKHLFFVASSLDSIVVGEPQILGQVKDAYEVSKKFGMIDSFFELFLQKTFYVAKKIRTETDIGKMAVSISSMAVELSSKVFETLHDKNALILGAGDMAELALSSLKRKKIQKVWIANRTFDTAAKLAKKFDAFPIYLEQFGEVLSQADIVIAAMGAPDYVVTRDMVSDSLEKRKQQPQLFLDISVPRNIDPAITDIQNAYLYNIDDLQTMVTENQQSRAEASEKAKDIIDYETLSFLREVNQKGYSPLIQKLQKKISVLLENEWKKSFSGAESKEGFERFKESVLQKLLVSPIHFLKNDDEKTADEKLELIEKVFDLDSEE